MSNDASQILPFLAGVIFGCFVGGLFVWGLLRRRKPADDGQSAEGLRSEIVLLTERLSSATEDLSHSREDVKELKEKAADLNTQMNSARDERTRFEERATRVPLLESQLSQALGENQQTKEALSEAREKLAGATSAIQARHEQIASLETETAALVAKCDALLTAQEQLKTGLAEATVTLDAERRQTPEKLALIDEAREKLEDRFKILANDILDEKAKRFTEQNDSEIGNILEPLKVKIHEFQNKVEQVYVQDSKDRTALSEQVKQLFGLNQQLSHDANNLAKALKGSNKFQGNWGELILERILEDSGLRKGHEYEVRENHTRADGTRAQPDIILKLPQGKHLILDSKVSLTAYTDYCSAEDDLSRETAIQRHISSLREHVRELSAQDYQRLYDLNSIDFVVMFVPIEPAFAVGLAHDNALAQDGWNKNILIAGPTTVLFAVRTVAYLWQQEWQKRNVQDIARRGGELYDKLCGFVADLQEIGKRLEQAKSSYDNAFVKFGTGRGNVIWQAETLRKLGVKSSKILPQDVLASALDDGTLLPENDNNHAEELGSELPPD
jgi:DNA recombination protein RmuC